MRLERTTPLRESAIVRSGLPGRALNRIERDHGARTVGELLQLILNADIDADFQAAFGLSNEAVRTLAGDLLGALPREHASAIQAPADFVLGAELEDGGPPALSAPPRRQILPDRCSMVEDLPPVADQGRRGSCVSQAATAVNEFYQGGKRRLSSQYLYARCKEDDGYPGPGTYPRVAAKLLREEGQCTERTLPYNPNQIPGNEGQGPVPLKARLEASLYKCHLPYAIDSTDVDFIQRLLVGLEVGGERLPPRPIFFAVQTFRGLMGGETARTGRVLMPLPGGAPLRGSRDGLRRLLRRRRPRRWSLHRPEFVGGGLGPRESRWSRLLLAPLRLCPAAQPRGRLRAVHEERSCPHRAELSARPRRQGGRRSSPPLGRTRRRRGSRRSRGGRDPRTRSPEARARPAALRLLLVLGRGQCPPEASHARGDPVGSESVVRRGFRGARGLE